MNTFTKLSNLKIAVTGAKGFIGSHLLDVLRSLGLSVLSIEADVRCRDTWKQDFDLLYHLAAVRGRIFKDSPADAFSVNIDGVLQALEACRRNKAHMIFTSTCGVYQPLVGSSLSEDSLLAAQNPYTYSKLAGEMLCHSYADHYGVKCTVLRLFNVYGSRQKSEFLIPYLIRCGLEERTAEIQHPNSARDFIHVTDVVDALLRVVEDKSSFSIFNVGSGRVYTVRNVIEILNQVLKSPILYKVLESQVDPQQSVCADVQRAGKELNWVSKVALEEGIQEVINDFSKQALRSK